MEYKSPKITVDGIILDENKERILLVQRGREPFKGKWALPGGFVEYGEKTEDAVVREVLEETGLKTKALELFGVYSDPNRDPRGHTITIVYLLDIINGEITSGDDAMKAEFFDLNNLPELSFDHRKIIGDFLRRKRNVLSKM
ncbi:MAG TPA: NUDIX hydrolase [Thermoplasmatales archaeon]|nr:NUDIX hydrolase [Thermoplasmatales archaeon]